MILLMIAVYCITVVLLVVLRTLQFQYEEKRRKNRQQKQKVSPCTGQERKDIINSLANQLEAAGIRDSS
jgi:hypothetical protein